MTALQLSKIIQATGFSPEQLSEVFYVSNMTLRRWAKESDGFKIPESSKKAIIEGVYQLIMEGKLDANLQVVKDVLKDSTSRSFEAVLTTLGIEPKDLAAQTTYSEEMAMALFQIGINKSHRDTVDHGDKTLQWFNKKGQDWKSNISMLTQVIKGKNYSVMDRMIAYGALFYLIAPLDLIPDVLVFAGVMDDYTFLAAAVAYYVAKFPKMIDKNKSNK